jgi:hypothetical protein
MTTFRFALLLACVRSTLITAARDSPSCVESRAELATAVALASSLETRLEEARQNVVAKGLQVRYCALGDNMTADFPEGAPQRYARGSGEAIASNAAEAGGAQVGHVSDASPFRSGMDEPRDIRAMHCFRANSSLGDSSCNCFGQPRPQTSDSKAPVTIVVGNWLGATVDAWMLKLLIEEQLGWPTEMIPDANLYAEEGLGGVWGALKSGYAMMHPEVRPSIVASRSVSMGASRGLMRATVHAKLPRFGIRKNVASTTNTSSPAPRYAAI